MAVIAEGIKLSDDQLEEVSGGFPIPGPPIPIPVPQIRACCDQCGWTSGWKLETSYKDALKDAVMHTALTGHYQFLPEERIHYI